MKECCSLLYYCFDLFVCSKCKCKYLNVVTVLDSTIGKLTIGIFLGQCCFRYRVFAETGIQGSTVVGHFFCWYWLVMCLIFFIGVGFWLQWGLVSSLANNETMRDGVKLGTVSNRSVEMVVVGGGGGEWWIYIVFVHIFIDI